MCEVKDAEEELEREKKRKEKAKPEAKQIQKIQNTLMQNVRMKTLAAQQTCNRNR